MRGWRLELEYEGTRYAGWQAQPHARTVQGELMKAAEQFLNARVEVGGSGRTDAGVHALRQVAHLRSNPAGRAPGRLLSWRTLFVAGANSSQRAPPDGEDRPVVRHLRPKARRGTSRATGRRGTIQASYG